MPAWKGIVGQGMDADQLEAYVASLPFGAWRPQFVVLHNTQVPRLADWHSVPGDQRMRGLERYYRDQLGWSGGPHLFVADDQIWLFTPLTMPGVHSPSWNAISWGVEVVGDYDQEALPAPVRANVVSALATLHAAAGLDPQSLRLHKQDPKTTHTFCPGHNLAGQRDAIVADVAAEIEHRHSGEHTPPTTSDDELFPPLPIH